MTWSRELLVVALVVLVTFWGGCQHDSPESSPYAQAIVAKLDSLDAAGSEHDIVRKFYGDRQYAPAWHDRQGRSQKVSFALGSLRLAEDHGLMRALYREPELTRRAAAHDSESSDAAPSPQVIADLDVDLTTAVIRSWPLTWPWAATTLPSSIDDGMCAVSVLTLPQLFMKRWPQSRPTGSIDWPRSIRSMRRFKRRSRSCVANSRRAGYKSHTFHCVKDRPHPAVAALRSRLGSAGYLPSDALASPRYDGILADAIKRFQEHHALPANGVVDRATLDALNVPLAARIAQVSVNLERWRWLPDDLGARHLVVNVPYFHLIAREQGTPVMDIRVVVGKRGDETPLFSEEMTEVVFSPYLEHSRNHRAGGDGAGHCTGLRLSGTEQHGNHQRRGRCRAGERGALE